MSDVAGAPDLRALADGAIGRVARDREIAANQRSGVMVASWRQTLTPPGSATGDWDKVAS